jgi:hypothetical protein
MSDNEVAVRRAVEIDINYDTYVLSNDEAIELMENLAAILGFVVTQRGA